jgi:hypothetical protein
MTSKRLEFCTYFDHRYLPRALALYRSLERHAGDFRLWALCLTPECEALVQRLALPSLQAVALAELETADPELAGCKPTRSPIEYYFTCSPCLPRYLLARHAGIETIVYLDSDLYFFADPRMVLEHLSGAAVGLTPHRLAPAVPRRFERYGRYNVGWVSFRRSGDALACLAWWRAQCLAWCYDRAEDGRYADQKYLEEFERRFGGVRSIELKGANLAPWNVANYALSALGSETLVDQEPLIFFHFQGISRLRAGLYDTNLAAYRTRMTKLLRERIYEPYLRELAQCETQVAALGAPIGSSLRRPRSLPGRIRHGVGRFIEAARSTLHGTRLRI